MILKIRLKKIVGVSCGNGYSEQLLYLVGPVQLSCFVEGRGNTLETGKVDDHASAQAPEAHEDERGQSPVRDRPAMLGPVIPIRPSSTFRMPTAGLNTQIQSTATAIRRQHRGEIKDRTEEGDTAHLRVQKQSQ